MSNFPKFRRGDIVKTSYNSKAKVLRSYKKDGKFRVDVEFESGIKNDYSEDFVSFYHEDLEDTKPTEEVEIPSKCPVCSSEWTKTKFGTRTWLDCKTCSKTAEDIVNSLKKEKEDKDFGTYNFSKFWG